MQSWKAFLFLTLLCLVVQGFFSMTEMACVSFNKVRLQYYVSKKKKSALWLNYLLNHPALLFGTTLIGVNTALFFGSECSRRFYDAIGLSPDFAPLSQIILVLIFAEITPMSLGRRYAEHMVLFGVPFLYFFSLLLRPIIFILDLLCRWINHLIGNPISSTAYLSREELQNAIEERENPPSDHSNKQELNTIVANIFSLKAKIAKDITQPLTQIPLVPAFCTVKELRRFIEGKQIVFVPIYHRHPQNIIAVAYLRDLLRIPENKRIKEYARSPWFIAQTTSILDILKQFRHNNQSLAIVLDRKGLARGVLTLDAIVHEIFGKSSIWESFSDILPNAFHVVLDRSFPAQMRLDEFNKQFGVHLAYQNAETLGEIVVKALNHNPSQGDSVRIDRFELIVEEISFLAIKTVLVKTVS